jgi:ABC-type anion transport system duplicated permease subunit
VVAQGDPARHLPYYVTGAITASGGSWNAAIVAEVASWGDTKLTAHGLGAYIAEATDKPATSRASCSASP